MWLSPLKVDVSRDQQEPLQQNPFSYKILIKIICCCLLPCGYVVKAEHFPAKSMRPSPLEAGLVEFVGKAQAFLAEGQDCPFIYIKSTTHLAYWINSAGLGCEPHSLSIFSYGENLFQSLQMHSLEIIFHSFHCL
jgi:hypothetical protein